MTEDDARAWIADSYGGTKVEQLERYVAILIAANQTQNLISRASEATIWVRHILDSAQLGRFASGASDWVDIGSGAGLPGIVLAVLEDKPLLMIEPRRKRADFLQQVVDSLDLRGATVRQAEISRISGPAVGAITARAFAPLTAIFVSAGHLGGRSTIWVLPKGRTAETELEEARQSWQGKFHVEHSLTDDDARIIVASDIRPR